MHISDYEIKLNCFAFAKLFDAYAKSSEKVQASIRETVEIINSDETSHDDKDDALETMRDLIYLKRIVGE